MSPEEYLPTPTAYKLIDEIGASASAIVYKAICLPNSTPVAVKSMDLDQCRADFDNIRRWLPPHPNILKAHCSFTVDSRLWVVMPFMSGGSLQSVISSGFPDGLPEPCIAIVLRETLNALSYIHERGHLHGDIKAGNILIDSDGQIKLADWGGSASIYEPQLGLTPIDSEAATPYWMAPEVIQSRAKCSFKADIWSFGITALELARGRPPLSRLPPSKSLLVKIKSRFRSSDRYEIGKQEKSKIFSEAMKDMVASCLDQDPSKRPSAEKLLKHAFFKDSSNLGLDFLAKNLLNGLPSVEERFKEHKVLNENVEDDDGDDDDADYHASDDDGSVSGNVKTRRISGWTFNVDGFELDPVISVVKQVGFGGETVIEDKKTESREPSEPGELGESGEPSGLSSQGKVGELGQGSDYSESGSGDWKVGEGNIDRALTLGGLMTLRRSLDEQKIKVINLIDLLDGELTREDQMVLEIARLKSDLEKERKKSDKLEAKLTSLGLTVSGFFYL